QNFRAASVGRESKWSQIVHIVADHERVIVSLGDFVAETGDVHESCPEESRADPAGIVQHPATFGIAARLEEVRVEAQNAAIVSISEEQKDVRKQERGDVFRGDDIIRDVGHYDSAQAALENKIGRVVVYQNKPAACSVRIKRESIIAAGGVGSGWAVCRLPNVHREGWLWSSQQKRVPVR